MDKIIDVTGNRGRRLQTAGEQRPVHPDFTQGACSSLAPVTSVFIFKSSILLVSPFNTFSLENGKKNFRFA